MFKIFNLIILCCTCVLFGWFVASQFYGSNNTTEEDSYGQVLREVKELGVLIRQWRYVDAISAMPNYQLSTEEVDSILSKSLR